MPQELARRDADATPPYLKVKPEKCTALGGEAGLCRMNIELEGVDYLQIGKKWFTERIAF